MTNSVQIIVKLFGSQQRDANKNEILLSFTHEPNCAQVIEAIGIECPSIKSSLSISRLALNHSFAPLSATVSDSDEVALVGLVGGG